METIGLKRAVWLLAACLLGGLMVLGLSSGLQRTVRAETAAASASAGDVVINEVAWMGTVDSTSDEWIEFYNTTDAAIDIANWSIQGADTGVCLEFPAADSAPTTTIPAGGYIIFWADDDEEQGATHTNFKLSAGGEVVALYGADGVTLIDGYTFGAQTADVAWGRWPDGVEAWGAMPCPTPGSPNGCRLYLPLVVRE